MYAPSLHARFAALVALASAISSVGCLVDIAPLNTDDASVVADASVEESAVDDADASVEESAVDDADASVEESSVGDDALQEADKQDLCDPGLADCDGSETNGCEVDTRTNPKHCGGCFHSCLGGDCSDGSCQPVVITTQTLSPFGLVLSSTNGMGDLYWSCSADDQWVWKASFDLSLVEQLVTPPADAGHAYGIAIDVTSVYWAEGQQGTIWAVDKNGYGFRKVADDPGLPRDLVVDNEYVYWVSAGSGEVRRALKVQTLGSSDVLASEQGLPIAIALSPTSVLWVNNAAKEIMRSDRDGANPCIIATTEFGPEDVAFADDWVFWREGTRDNLDEGRIMKAREECDTQEVVVLAEGQGDPRFFALDADYVYFTVLAAGTVRRVPRDGGDVETVFASQDDTHGVAVDDKAIYWSSYLSGKVMRLAK